MPSVSSLAGDAWSLVETYLKALDAQPASARVAFWAGVTGIAVAVLASVYAVSLRIAFRAIGRSQNRVAAAWDAYLIGGLMAENSEVPPLRRGARRVVLARFNYLAQTLKGDSREDIRTVGISAQLDTHAAALARSRNVADRLTALVAVSHLRAAGAWDSSRHMLEDQRPSVSISAAAAMLAIDPRDAMLPVMSAVTSRHDWHPVRMGPVLFEARSSIGTGLAWAFSQAVTERKPAIAAIIHAVQDPEGLAYIRDVLRARSDTAEVLAACAGSIAAQRSPLDDPLFESLLHHSDPHVVAIARQALGA